MIGLIVGLSSFDQEYSISSFAWSNNVNRTKHLKYKTVCLVMSL